MHGPSDGQTLRLLSLLLFATGCSATEDAPTKANSDAGPCGEGLVEQIYFDEPGCGLAAKHRCVDPAIGEDACLSTACGCSGGTISGGCGYLLEPFVSLGECGADDTMSDSTTEAASDADSAPCGAGQHLAYTTPGCVEAMPVCVSDIGDACAATACACDGSEITGCGSYSKPYRALGACPKDAGPG